VNVIPAVDATVRRVEAPGVPMGSGRHNFIPHNFDQIMMQRQLDDENEASVLYKFAHSVDLIREYNIKKHIFCRTCTNIMEMVVLQGVKEWELHVMGYFANHVVGPLLVNIPTEGDPTRLRHVINITNDTTSKEVYQALAKNLNETQYPIHFVISARFNVKFSNLTHKIASDYTIARIVKSFKP